MSSVRPRKIQCTTDKPRVVIIGAGIAGLTVAHELQRTGAFEIEIIEKRPRAGGKARTEWQGRRFREHSMRVLPGSYVCMHQVMKEIETPRGPVIDRLRPASLLFQHGERRTEVRGRYPMPFGFFSYASDVLGLLWFLWRAGVTLGELRLFLYKVMSLLWLPQRKVRSELSRLTFADYIGERRTGPGSGFDEVIFRLSELLVAAKSHASAGVVTRTLLEWFVMPFLRGEHVLPQFSEFDSPTSEALVEPWVAALEGQGVRFRFEETVVAIRDDRAGRILGVELSRGKDQPNELVEADAYVVAVQHNIADALLPDHLRRYIPALVDFPRLGEEWAHSVQFVIEDLHGRLAELGTHHVAVIDSPWSIAYQVYSKTSWNECWDDCPLEDDQAILTATISNSRRPGVVHGLPFLRCTEKQILEEVLSQARLADSLGVEDGKLGLDIEIVSADSIDVNSPVYAGHGISAVGHPDEPLIFVSDSLMYIRLPGNLDIEPDNATGIFNLLLAGEYTKTNYRIPTMEKSCESGKRCAQTVVESFGFATDETRVPRCDLPLTFLRSEWVRVFVKVGFYVGTLAMLAWLWLRTS